MAVDDDDAVASPAEIVHELQSLVAAVRAGSLPAEQADARAVLVDALGTLREIREVLAAWEPELVTAARGEGVSWALLAPALGVASRQAAERRYLRTQPTGNAESTKEARVQATRDRRAGERAVTVWARQNSAELRQLAGQVSDLAGLSTDGRHDADRVHAELGGNDTAALLDVLVAMRSHLERDHSGLAARITAMSEDADQQRQDALDNRQSATDDHTN